MGRLFPTTGLLFEMLGVLVSLSQIYVEEGSRARTLLSDHVKVGSSLNQTRHSLMA